MWFLKDFLTQPRHALSPIQHEAAKTLADVRKAMKIDYFEDADLIAEHTKKYQG